MSNIKLDFKYECKNSVLSFNSLDNGVNRFTISIENFGEDVNLDNSIAVVAILKPSGKVSSQFGEVKCNEIIVDLEKSATDEIGVYVAKLLLVSGDKRKMTRSFKYEVEQENILSQILDDVVETSEYPLLTDMLSRLSTIEIDEEQRQINESERILNEEARQMSESSRVEAELTREHNDADREKAEAVRGTNENTRVKAEKSRFTNENARVEAESLRVEAETKRVEAENLRNDNYNFMTSDEERRRSEENNRIETEKLRVEAEKSRVNEEGKRKTVEKARVVEENKRSANEYERKANEVIRENNENSRVQAEATRSNRYEAFISDAEGAVNDFKAYTSSAKVEEEDRKDNEALRVSAEDVRKANEVARISNENTRKANEIKRVEAETVRQNSFNAKISEVNVKISEVDNVKNSMVADTKNAIDKMTNDFNSLSASQQQDAEVILARDGEESLNARFKRDLFIEGKSLKQEVIDLGGLKESQDMAYSSDNIANYSGNIVCEETKNGTVKDLRVSGKSLLNLIASMQDVNGRIYALTLIRDIMPGEHTLIANLGLTNYSGRVYAEIVFADNTENSNYIVSPTCVNGTNVFNINFNKAAKSLRLKISKGDYDAGSRMVVLNSVLLEGDHTQNPPSYFEGVASVGNGVDKIEVSTVWTNGNLVDNDKIFKDSNFDNVNGDEIRKLHTKGLHNIFDDNVQYVVDYNVDVIEGSNSTFAMINYKDGGIAYATDSSKPIKSVKPIKSITWTYGNNCKIRNAELIVNKIEVEKTNINKSDKKPILFKDTDGTWKPVKELRGLDTVCDTIELHSDGKYYYHQRTLKQLFDSSFNQSNIRIQADYGDVTRIDFIGLNDVKTIINAQLICDKFTRVIISTPNAEGVNIHGTQKGVVQLQLKTSKLQSKDAQGVIQYLGDNPFLLITELAEEKVFEVNPLFLESYEGETMASVNSGVVNAPMEFKIASYITNLVLLNQQRISILEEQVIGMFKSVLNGDMRTLAEALYPQDFVFSDDEIMLLDNK